MQIAILLKWAHFSLTIDNPATVQAIEFVQLQQDDELWDLLIALALSQAPLTGQWLLSI